MMSREILEVFIERLIKDFNITKEAGFRSNVLNYYENSKDKEINEIVGAVAILIMAYMDGGNGN